MESTAEQVKQFVEIVRTVGEIIQAHGSVPSGELFARLMGHMSLAQYLQIIEILKAAGRVVQKNNVLTWIER